MYSSKLWLPKKSSQAKKTETQEKIVASLRSAILGTQLESNFNRKFHHQQRLRFPTALAPFGILARGEYRSSLRPPSESDEGQGLQLNIWKQKMSTKSPCFTRKIWLPKTNETFCLFGECVFGETSIITRKFCLLWPSWLGIFGFRSRTESTEQFLATHRPIDPWTRAEEVSLPSCNWAVSASGTSVCDLGILPWFLTHPSAIKATIALSPISGEFPSTETPSGCFLSRLMSLWFTQNTLNELALAHVSCAEGKCCP